MQCISKKSLLRLWIIAYLLFVLPLPYAHCHEGEESAALGECSVGHGVRHLLLPLEDPCCELHGEGSHHTDDHHVHVLTEDQPGAVKRLESGGSLPLDILVGILALISDSALPARGPAVFQKDHSALHRIFLTARSGLSPPLF